MNFLILATTTVTLTLAHTNAGVIKQAPVDTLTIDGVKILGTAMPTTSVVLAGDLNGDGAVSTSDIMLLIGYVLMKRPLPEITVPKDTANIQVVLPSGKIYNFTRTDGKAVR